MTFVPRTFELVSDDLLTALTGGVTREEHRFRGAAEPYAVASSDVLPESVRVTGEVGEKPVRFERDIDYQLDQAAGVIRWREGTGARRPDSDTYFHVNYYRSETPRRLTDRNPGSVNFLLAAAFAREIAVLQRQMRMIYESAFADLATGTSLDHVAALLGLVRRDARFALGEVLFVRNTPAAGDITIPAGTLVSTEAGQVFETVERRTLQRGQLSLTAAIRAMIEGTTGRVDARSITIVNRPIFGIDGVNNPEPTYFASEPEIDDAFRRRIRGALERAGKASVEAIRLELLETVPGLDATNVQVVERDTPGVVDVRLGVGDAVNEEMVRRVDEALLKSRPAGIRVTHNLRRTRGGGDEGSAQVVLEGVRPAVKLEPDVVARNEEGILALQVSVLLRLADRNLSSAQKETVMDEVRQRVTAYFGELPMGAPIIHAKLLARVASHEAVGDTVVRLGPPGAARPSIERNLDTEGRKARVPAPNVSLNLMAEAIRLDVLALVAASGQRPASAHDDAVRRELEALSPPGGSTLSRADIAAAVGRALSQTTPALTLAGDAAVVVNATYDDTGRVLLNPDTVTLAENHVLAWQTIALRAEEMA